VFRPPNSRPSVLLLLLSLFAVSFAPCFSAAESPAAGPSSAAARNAPIPQHAPVELSKSPEKPSTTEEVVAALDVESAAGGVSPGTPAVSHMTTPPVIQPGINRFARDAQPKLAKSKFAWVMMHYEGTPKDDEYLLGLRVLIRSIQ
jgi:hypothetical protein